MQNLTTVLIGIDPRFDISWLFRFDAPCNQLPNPARAPSTSTNPYTLPVLSPSHLCKFGTSRV